MAYKNLSCFNRLYQMNANDVVMSAHVSVARPIDMVIHRSIVTSVGMISGYFDYSKRTMTYGNIKTYCFIDYLSRRFTDLFYLLLS